MRFADPTSAEEAVKLLSEESGLAKVLAGGTDLLVQMKSGIIEPDLIVDIKKIPGIREIIPENGGYRIGAAVSGSVKRSAGAGRHWPSAGVPKEAGLLCGPSSPAASWRDDA